MKLIDKITISFIAIVLTVLICISVNEIDKLQNKTKMLEKRIQELEFDYKIYELNLQNLEENKDVQFGRK
ncbi:MAG: hypothetical protein IKE89_03540 [Bacilli bacterium]|nr:hypothetical protein [Bacilli bacterium]MBR2711525.1 hypothetical protein [Bacilli bacterium]